MGSRPGELRNIEDLCHDRPERVSVGVVRVEQLLNRRTDHCPKRSLFGSHVDEGDQGIDNLTASRCIRRADNRLKDTLDPLRKFGAATVSDAMFIPLEALNGVRA